MSVPRKLTDEDVSFLREAASRHRTAPSTMIAAAARLAYVEQRLAEAERLLREVDVWEEQDLQIQQQRIDERRAFLAEVTHE